MRTPSAVRLLSVLALWLMFTCLVPSAHGQSRAARPAVNDSAQALDLLAQLNGWRIAEGLAPLKPNATLEQMALVQAQFVRSLMDANRSIADFHVDAAGRNPRQRAYQLYGWETYGTPDQIEIGENAAVGNVPYAINYWANSSIHRRVALSGTYHEVGVAAIPTNGEDDMIFMAVFGARPETNTVLVSPGQTTLYLMQDRSRYSATSDIAPRIRLFSEAGDALTGTLNWSSTVAIPPHPTDALYILFTEGDFQAIVRVDLLNDVAVLPETSISALTATAAAPSPTVTFTPAPSDTPSPTLFAANTATPTVTPTLGVTLTPTVAPTDITNPDLIITYDANVLVVRVTATTRPDLTQLRLTNALGEIAMDRWLMVASFPAEAFPANHCLQVYRAGAIVSTPSGCSFVRSAVQFNANRIFWTSEPFDVMIGDRVVGTCAPSADGGRCLVRLN
jgi:uncharacterized protein YkwD